MKSNGALFNPGEKAPVSGQFGIVRRGRRTGLERTLVRGEPPPRKRDRCRVADRSRNRAGRNP